MSFLSKITGWLVLATLVCFLLSVAHVVPVVIPTVFAWCANVAVWSSLPSTAKRQVSLLLGIGVVALAYAATQGVWMPWQSILAVNLPMLAMFVAVSFLDLTTSADTTRPLPKGLPAIINTALGVQILGAVINLSVVMVFADRLKGFGKLTDSQQLLLTRCFAGAAWWSPFFVATGVALTYAPGMKWQDTLIPGIFMALAGIAYTCVDAYKRSKGDFSGYPIRRESLFIPLFLAIAVLVCHYFWPSVNILVLICLLSPIAGVLLMRARPRTQTLYLFVDQKLPRIGSQFALFLAAGIFSNGIGAIIRCFPDLFNLQNFTFSPMLFSVALAAIVLAGIVGIHPIVSIAVASPLLWPLQPDPTQLGFLYLSSWALSAGTSPLTGIGLLVTSRYQISSKRIFLNSWHYAIFMWLLCSMVNALFL